MITAYFITAYFITASILIIIYSLLILIFSIGWSKPHIHQKTIDKLTILPFVSVVIAVRNEERNLPSLLNHLAQQNYHADSFEIIFSDDFSQDQTINIISDFIRERRNFKLITSQYNDLKGKKAALKRAIDQSNGSIILTTDGDCTMGKEWLRSMVEKLTTTDAQMIIGPVVIQSTPENLFSKLQALEFMSLTGATAGASNINRPIMCNGANMAYKKSAWEKVRHKISGQQFASGDDVFLLHAFQLTFKGKILFAQTLDAAVYTQAADNVKDFFSQRARWAGKSVGYSDSFTLFTGFFVAGTNILVAFSLLLILAMKPLQVFIISLFFLKILVDFPLIYSVAVFTKQRQLLSLYPIVAIAYPFYVCCSIFSAILKKPTWKKRILSKSPE